MRDVNLDIPFVICFSDENNLQQAIKWGCIGIQKERAKESYFETIDYMLLNPLFDCFNSSRLCLESKLIKWVAV